jgi:hypothetical protein
MEKDIIDERNISNSLYRERAAKTYFFGARRLVSPKTPDANAREPCRGRKIVAVERRGRGRGHRIVMM